MVNQGYKQTEVAMIPEDWEVMTLGDVCCKNGIVRGPFGGALKKEIFVSDGYKVYEQGNAIYRSVTRGKYYIDSNKYNEMLRFAVNSGDFIVSCSGTIGMIYQIPNNAPKGIINQALLKLTVDKTIVDSNYFYLYFSWEDFNKRITDDSQGGAIKNRVSMELFKKTWLLRPTLPEQERIAEALSDVDSMISSLEKLIAKKKAIKQGAMQELLTGKKRLQGFGEHWVKVKLNDIFEFHKGNGLSKEKITPDGKSSCILYGELFTRYSEVINNIVNKTNCNEGLKSCKYDVLMPGSTTTNGLDLATASVVLEDDVLLGGDIVVLRPKKIMDTRIFGYLFRLMVKEILQHTQGITIVHLNTKTLREMEVLIPKTVEEQTAIISIFSDMDNEIEALEQKLAKTRQVKQGMMQQLLTGKIRLV